MNMPTPIQAANQAVKSSYEAYKAWEYFLTHQWDVITDALGKRRYGVAEIDNLIERANSFGIHADMDVRTAFDLVPQGASFVVIKSLLREAEGLMVDFEGSHYDAAALYYKMWLLTRSAWELYNQDD